MKKMISSEKLRPLSTSVSLRSVRLRLRSPSSCWRLSQPPSTRPEAGRQLNLLIASGRFSELVLRSPELLMIKTLNSGEAN